jgi:DNA/RNA-binding domain of Phe-tRNA-synthetase-like protein
MFIVSDEWKRAYPDAFTGVLVMSGVANPSSHPELNRKKTELEERLRGRFRDAAHLRADRTMLAYKDYYKRFKKSYHVLQQLESVMFKGKPIPVVSALVEAMFMAELEDMLLTAGHDLDAILLPVTLRVSEGHETYTRINGENQALKAGDMFMADTDGVISSVVYGPDQRTRITPSTRRVMFATYAPTGIPQDEVRQHLGRIEANVRTFSPYAHVELIKAY